MPIAVVTAQYSGYTGTPYYSSWHFGYDETAWDPDAAGEALADFMDGVLSTSTSLLNWELQTEVPVLDEATDEVSSYVTISPQNGAGSGSGLQHPPATQGLLQLRTAEAVAGRRLRGKFFIPALSASVGAQAPGSASRTSWVNAAIALNAASASFGPWVVYSRAHGVAAEITTISAWEKYAVLRSRRD